MPVELDALLPPLPPTLTGVLAVTEPFATLAVTEGVELTGLDWTAPV